MQNMRLPSAPTPDGAGGLRPPYAHGVRLTPFFPATSATGQPSQLWHVDPDVPRTPTMVRSSTMAPLSPSIHGLRSRVHVGGVTLPAVQAYGTQ